MMWAFSSSTCTNLSKGHSLPCLDEVKSWCPLKLKRKKNKVSYIFFLLLHSQNFLWEMNFNCNFMYFIFHLTPCNKYKKNVYTLLLTNFFIYCTFFFTGKKIINHVFKVMMPALKLPAISKKMYATEQHLPGL